MNKTVFQLFQEWRWWRYVHYQISSSSWFVNFMQERDRGYTPAYLSFACLKSEWRPIFSCARSFSTLRVQVVLRRPFCSFHPAAVFLLPPEKLSDNQPLWEALSTWPNKYNWFKLVMSFRQKKTLAWNRTCRCKLQFILNAVPFLQQFSKLRKMHFQQLKIFSIFFLQFLLSNLVST